MIHTKELKIPYTHKRRFNVFIKYLEDKGLLYSVPYAATLDEWSKWRSKIKKEYPIQYFIRESLGSVAYSFAQTCRTTRYRIRTFLFPENKLIRATIPVRGSDLTDIVLNMNLAAILQFKEEADKSLVDWDSDAEQKEFKAWLDTTAAWIKEGRDKMTQELNNAYPNITIYDLGKLTPDNIKELYSEVNRIEQVIAQTNEAILLQLVKYREHLWT